MVNPLQGQGQGQGQHPDVDGQGRAQRGEGQEEEEREAVTVAALREAVGSLKPVMCELGLVPSRVCPFIPASEEGDHRHVAYDYLIKSIREVVSNYEAKGKVEEGVEVFVDKLVAEDAPPHSLPLFMQALDSANRYPSRPNEGAWLVHDVTQLSATYLPLQTALTSFLALRSRSCSRFLQRLLATLEPAGMLTEQKKEDLLEAAARGDALGSLVVPRALAHVYLAARLEPVPPRPHHHGGDRPPSWLLRLLDCVKQCEMEEKEEEEGKKKEGVRGEEGERSRFRSALPAAVLSPVTWARACEKLLSTQQHRTRDIDDGTRSEAGTSTITENTLVNTDLKEQDLKANEEYHKLVKDIDRLLGGECVDATKQQRVGQFVDEVIDHSLRVPWTASREAAASSDDGSSVVTVEDNTLVDNSQQAGGARQHDPSVSALARTLKTSGLAQSPEGRQPGPIVLKAFQEESLCWARRGRNVAIFLPTGTGKTFLVLRYVQELLSESRPPASPVHVLFMAPKVKLAEQQYHRFLKYFPDVTYLRTGKSRSSNAPFSELLKMYKVFVMTPRCVVEAVERKEVGVGDFSLLVLDECHHAIGRHDYKVLMDLYMDTKFSPNAPPMPQVVGLTASPGAGKGDSVDSAVSHIKQLCFNLDVDHIDTVVHNIAELQEFSSKPTSEIHKCSPRKKDGFKKIIESMMKSIEEDIVQCAYVQRQPDREVREELRKSLTAPDLNRGELRYTQWVRQLMDQLDSLVDDRQAYSQLFASLEMLERYQKSLSLNENCESRYALEFLQAEVRGKEAVQAFLPKDEDLVRHFHSHEQKLEVACMDGEDFNPRLQTLEDILLRLKEKNPEECACMVFVKTIDLTLAIQRWIQDHPDLRSFNPGRMYGSRRGVGMTTSEISDVLDKFNKGDHKVLVCTSVAEEGLDIQACSVVIRYDYRANVIAMIQTRGRARHRDSEYHVLGSHKPDTADKEKGSMAAERLMNSAIAQVKQEMTDNPNAFLQDMTHKQRADLEARKIEAERASLKRRRQDVSGVVYSLLCFKCQVFACSSSDLRLLNGSNTLVMGEEFQRRWKRVEKKGKLAEKFQEGLEKTAKAHCQKCGCEWGCVVRYTPTGVEYPVLKIKSFLFEGDDSGPVKKFKGIGGLPFTIQEITPEELGHQSTSA
ncbi:ATP-dependent RNA helicase DHX58-like [Babylonia areolata]|uniref:ATP-dependent RNA helicase DHX58-like n=1 Tax=Babylonia areolata TaxID=304850 RepID=UPI003FCF8B5E